MNSTKLIGLLTSLPPPASDCRAVLCENMAQDDTAAYHATGPVPINEVRDIYRTRARLNARRGGPIRGFEELLAGLEAPDVGDVLIHAVQAPGGRFFAFTDPSVSRLIGLLEFPPAAAKPDATGPTAHAA